MIPSRYFWLSFAGDKGFLGATIIESSDIKQAIKKAWKLGVNPGGEVKSLELPHPHEADLLPFVPNRLYSKAEIEALGGAMKF